MAIRAEIIKQVCSYIPVADELQKTLDLIQDDWKCKRPYNVGDTLRLHEYNCGVYTERTVDVKATYILRSPEYCKEGYCIIGIKLIKDLAKLEKHYIKRAHPAYDGFMIKAYIQGFEECRLSVLDIVAGYCPDDDGTCSKLGADLRELLDDIENI